MELFDLGTDSSPWAQNDKRGGGQNDNNDNSNGDYSSDTPPSPLRHSGGLVFFMFPLIPDGFIAAVRIDQALHRNVGPPQIPLVLLA